MIITLKDIANPKFVDNMLANKPKGMATMKLFDGDIDVPVRRALLSAHLMRPMVGRVPITKEFVYYDEKFTMSGINKLYNKIDKAWEFIGGSDRDLRTFMKDLALNIDALDNFALEHMMSFQDSFDVIDIITMMEQKPLKDIRDNIKLENIEGTKVAEKKITRAGKELERILKNGTDHIDFNPLYLHINDINMNQLIQVLLAYGPRSDIDDSMLDHVVKGNSLQGLRDFDDFWIESHSAKKSNWFLKDAISNSQYSSRKVQLACFELRHLEHMDCGTTETQTLTILDSNKHNFIGSYIDNGDGDRYFLLTKENINQFVNKTVKIFTALGCKVKNGTCAHCMGRVGNYIPHGMHIGLLCASILLSAITQKILSAKHLVKTFSQMYKLDATMSKFFRTLASGIYKYTDEELEEQRESLAKYEIDDQGIVKFIPVEEDTMSIEMYRTIVEDNVVNDTEIFWRDQYQNVFNKGAEIIIPLAAFHGAISDINLNPPAKNFTSIQTIRIQDPAGMYPVPLKFVEDESSSVYLSKYTLEFIKDRMVDKEAVRVDDKHMYVRMEGFDVKQPFVISSTVNVDVIKFVAQVNGFLQGKLPKYTNANEALTDFCDLIYRESVVPISHVATVLKAFTVTSEDDPSIPIIEDMNNMMFASTNNAISRTPSGRQAYEDLKRYFSDPKTYLQKPVSGLVDPLFGIIDSIVDK